MEALSADKQQVLAREERWGKPVAYAAVAVAVMFLAGLAISITGPLDRDSKSSQLLSFHDHSSVLAVQTVLTLLGFLLLIPVLWFLFRAVQARNEKVRPQLFGFVFIGPVVLAVQTVISWIATNSVANDFVDQVGTLTGDQANDLAQKLLDDSSLVPVAASMAIPGILGLIAVVFYLSLVSMRAGLLSRFWGTFGMAFSIGFLIMGPIGVTIWTLYVGLLAARWITPPPAWDAVRAIPWPAGGMQPDGPDEGDGPVEASGREIEAPDQPAGTPADDGPIGADGPSLEETERDRGGPGSQRGA